MIAVGLFAILFVRGVGFVLETPGVPLRLETVGSISAVCNFNLLPEGAGFDLRILHSVGSLNAASTDEFLNRRGINLQIAAS